MGNFAQYQTTGDTIQDALDTAARERGLYRNSPGTPQAHPKGRPVQVDVSPDGRQIVRDNGRREAATAQPLREGHVIIPGLGETTIEAARAAGLLPPGFQEAGKTLAAPAGNHQVELQAQQQQPSGDQEAPKGAPDATDVAERVIGSLVGKLGGETVSDGIFLAAETGDFDSAIPPGVEEADVEALVEGFVQQANAILKSAGSASVPMLTETLTDAELREARLATIHNDKEKLAHFGNLAVQRMETLPYQDAEAFADLIADMPAEERKALSKNSAGEWIVTIRGRAMTFGEAVRAGLVRVG
ncbi:hypothetical protein [Mesorhizobium sp. YM1C-6-2]|uniref:hypothetical protein n=1 Tax=Mesorhizobium sp. YM1C-6-2 TaxID=1827501 RepID=UPI000EF20770|nr:hypothetical protein [Mesorhizobium sp. YM1C-6-2]RLP26596.1 hypothetical protein D8676_04990 [Mesorhizobium sp. YM1C-6-2]